MGRRVLLADVGEATQYDSTTLATGCALTNGNKTLTRTAVGSSAGATRTARPRSIGKLFIAWEVLVNSASAGSVVGLQTQAHTNTTSLGQLGFLPSGESWGYSIGNSAGTGMQVSHNGANTAVASNVTVGQFALMAVDLDNGLIWFGKATALTGGTVTWWLSGNPVTGANPNYSNLLTAGAGGPIGISGTGTLKNSIKRKFYAAAHPVIQNNSVKIVSDRESLNAICPAGFTPWGEFAYIASEGYVTYPSDTPPNRYYAGRIKDDGDPVYQRKVSLRQWSSGRAGSSPIGSCDMENSDGGLDNWLAYDLRDMPIRWRMGNPTAALSTFTDVGRSTIERLDVSAEDTMRFVSKDVLAQLDQPLQVATYPNGITNTVLEGKPIPLAFGRNQWVPLIVADPSLLEYHLHDDELGRVLELIDQGVVITQTTGWDIGGRTDATGVRRVTNPNGRQAATMEGQVALGADALGGIGTFTTWTGDNPSGWTVTETSPSLVTQGTSNSARFVRSTAVTVRAQTPGNVLTSGQLYYVTVRCTAWVSGSLDLQDSAGVQLCRITKVGTYRFSFVAGGTRAFRLDMSANGDLSIDDLFVYAATLVERLPAWLAMILRDRGPMETADYDATSINALDAATTYKLGFWSDRAERVLDVLQDTMQSFTGWMWVDRLQVIKVGRLVSPVVAGGEPTYTDIELYGDITVSPDLASGLSDRLAGIRNYSVHQESEIAGSLYTTAPGRITAAQLKEEWLAIRKGATALHGQYAFAKSAEPLPTLLTDATQVQTEASRMTGLWAPRRCFYKFAVFIEGGAGYLLEPGQVVVLQSDRFGLNSGLPVVLTDIKSRFLSDLVEIEAWGAAPAPAYIAE